MNEIIIYRPYRSYAWFLPFIIPVGVLAFVAAGYCFPHGGSSIFWTAIGIVCTWLTKVFYDSSNVVVAFEQEGLRIIGGRYNDYRYVLWDNVSNAYYVRNSRGFLFLVLSPKALSPKEAKNLANRGAHSSKMCIDNVVVIHIDDLQNASQIKERIVHKVFHVDVY